LSLFEPVVATALAWALLGQTLSLVQIFGGVILLGGALIVRLAGRPEIAPPVDSPQTGITVGTIMGRRR
jgi:drug/metabolite transporter (DMT)-like permease